MSPELEAHHKQVNELLPKAMELFEAQHPFVTMMLLSTIIANWVVNHPTNDHARVWAALMQTAMEMAADLLDQEGETVH